MKKLFYLLIILTAACGKDLTNDKISSSTENNVTATTDFIGYNSYGQSLAVGGSGSSLATILPLQQTNAVMFNLGVRTIDYIGSIPTSFVPLAENISPDGIRGETPCTATSEIFNTLSPQNDFKLLAFASGQPHQDILALSKGGKFYGRYMANVQTAENISSALAKTFSMGATLWTQGENDYTDSTSYDDYKSRLIQLISDLSTDIPAITGQVTQPYFIINQISSNNRSNAGIASAPIARAQYDVAANNPNVTIATPLYMLDFLDDNTHLTDTSYAIMGAYDGIALKYMLIDNKKNYVYLESEESSGNDIYLTFNVPAPPLVLDTSWVTNPGNYGFKIKSTIGTNLKISLVEVTNDNKIHIKCTSNPVGSTLDYAINNGLRGRAGRINGVRGNLRDSQGRTLVFDSTGINFPLNNYCTIFQTAIK